MSGMLLNGDRALAASELAERCASELLPGICGHGAVRLHGNTGCRRSAEAVSARPEIVRAGLFFFLGWQVRCDGAAGMKDCGAGCSLDAAAHAGGGVPHLTNASWCWQRRLNCSANPIIVAMADNGVIGRGEAAVAPARRPAALQG
jgi:hypothetical protein